ncbi:MAG: hypothetical protein M3020_02505 [Myxococcota bacterium]|nr:hypothetical protein [Myxococcota bacterium]
MLTETVGIVLRRVADRPRSEVRLWFQGKDAGETVLVGEQLVPLLPRGSQRAREAQMKRFVGQATELLRAASRSQFDSRPIRKSPIAAAISKLTLSDTKGLFRHIVVITDGKEVSFTDFECGFLPSEKRFIAALKKRGLLSPGSLVRSSVEFAYLRGEPTPGRGCPVQVDREVQIRALWTAALRLAGAEQVRMSAGQPTLFEASEVPERAEEHSSITVPVNVSRSVPSQFGKGDYR